MHLPDGVLPVREWLPLAVVGSGAFAAASTRARQVLDVRRVPVVGFLGAVALVLQLINFPLLGGASGHLTGTALLVFAAGLEVATVTMASVLVVQALLLQDGGLLALGANYVNMVVIPALVARLFEPIVRGQRGLPWYRGCAAGVAAWCGNVAGALSCAVQLAVADIVPVRTALLWMGGCHALVGAVEGVLTGVSVTVLARRRLLHVSTNRIARDISRPGLSNWLTPVLALAALAAVLVPLASERPDVLETLLQHVGRLDHRGR